MMTSLAVWAVIVGYVITEWGSTAMLTYVPTYMNEVLKFDIKQVLDHFQSKTLLNSSIDYRHRWLEGALL